MAPITTTMATFTNTTKSSLVDNLIDLAYLYGLSFQKLDSFQNTRRDNTGLRKWVLIQNFVNQRLITHTDATQEPLEWSEEDVKKDEENWLDAQLDGLDEEENFEAGYVYISRSSEGINKGDTIMITEDIRGDQQRITTYINGFMDIDEEMLEPQEKHRINSKNNSLMDIVCQSPDYRYDHHLFTTSVDHNYHHWKDKSTIPIQSSSLSHFSHKETKLKPTSNSSLVLPSISAYRPFFYTQPLPPQQQQQHPSLKRPGFFRKYCLDRDYLVGINPAEIDDLSPLTNNNNKLAPHSTTSANAALLNLVKLYHQSADGIVKTPIDPQKRTRDDMALICSSIVPSAKISQEDVAGILEYFGSGTVDCGARRGQITTLEDSPKIWFVGGDEKIDSDRQKMVSL